MVVLFPFLLILIPIFLVALIILIYYSPVIFGAINKVLKFLKIRLFIIAFIIRFSFFYLYAYFKTNKIVLWFYQEVGPEFIILKIPVRFSIIDYLFMAAVIINLLYIVISILIWIFKTIKRQIFFMIHPEAKKEYQYKKNQKQNRNIPVQNNRAAPTNFPSRDFELINNMNHLSDAFDTTRENINALFEKIAAKTNGTINATVCNFMDEFYEKDSAFCSNYNVFVESVNLQMRVSVMNRCSELLVDLKVLCNDIEKYYNSLPDSFEDNTYQQSTNDIENNEFDASLFAGCNTKESLSKRYKTLMKTFHPDNEDGDTEMTQKIQITYEKLLQEYN